MDPATERRLAAQLEIEEIKTLKYAYMRHMMLGTIDEMRPLLCDDVKASYSDGKYSYEGADAVLDFLREHHRPEAGLNSTWQLGHPEIELTSDDSARGVWFFTHRAIHQPSGANIEMAAFYDDRYRKQAGAWRIASTGYRRLLDQSWNRADLPSLKVEVL